MHTTFHLEFSTESVTLMTQNSTFDTDVAIVGAGPVGTLLAILLGQQGHRAIVVEKHPVFYDRPRAVTYDHEIARIFGYLGIDSDDHPAIEQHDTLYYWKNAAGESLMEVDWNSITDSGFRTRYWFNQPDLERYLRDTAEQYEGIEIHCGWRVNGLLQDDDSASITLQNMADDTTDTLRAKYVVGADGANSYIRDALGLAYNDHGFFYDWLIVDVLPHEIGTWEPAHWQLCDPKRPTTIVPGGPGRRRWEYMALPGEDLEELASAETAWELLKPWSMTPENSQLERTAIYRFRAACADAFHQGRGIIAGDAAHLMPPFAGEGMCAGIRDALALGWRLDLLLRGVAGQELLTSYSTERREHVNYYIDFSVMLGEVICITDEDEARQRDERMIDELQHAGDEPVDTDVAVLGPGLWVEGSPLAGQLSVQGFVTHKGKTSRFDDMVGRGWIVVGWEHDPTDSLNTENRRALDKLGAQYVHLGPEGSNAQYTDNDIFQRWFDKTGHTFAIIRPDFYTAATATTAEQLNAHIQALTDKLLLPSLV